MSDEASILSRFATLPAYGGINIKVGRDGSCVMFASRMTKANPPEIPVIEVRATSLIEGMKGMIQAFKP